MVKNTIIKRALIVVFWIGIIFSFLYVERTIKYFRKKRSINVFMWSGAVDEKMIIQFEKETGIRVNASYYEGNEELLVKLLATKGLGYDFIVPSDYVVEFLIKNDLLKKLDKSKLNFIDSLNPKFLNYYFDPHNEYSVPAEWYIQVFGINKDYFKDRPEPQPRWATIFDHDTMPHHVGLMNDSRELIGLAVNYLYGSVRSINRKETKEIKRLLRKQKQKVEAYTDFRGDFLLESGSCSIVMVASSFIWKTVRDNKNIYYVVPEDGTYLNIENYVIPKASQKEELVYQFMNFLFRLDVQKNNFEKQTFLSTRKDADFMFNAPELKPVVDYIHPESTKPLYIFQNKLTDRQVNEIWIETKGS